MRWPDWASDAALGGARATQRMGLLGAYFESFDLDTGRVDRSA